MTVREWFRVLRREADATDQPVAAHALVDALRERNWSVAEFYWLLLRAMLEQAKGQHRWKQDGYHWACTACGATVPSDDIDEREPSPAYFDPTCQCRACQPCEGRRPA